MEVGEVFGTLRAIDPDDGENGTVTYRLQNSDLNFDINKQGLICNKISVARFMHRFYVL